MLLYYITDRHAFSGSEAEKRARLLDKIAEAASCGVDFIQLREKDLSPRELESLAREAVRIVREETPSRASRILVNSRTDIALATGADGVHLTSNDIAASDARVIASRFYTGRSPRTTDQFVVAVSCHSVEEVRLAEAHGADFAVFAPVFEKSVALSEAKRKTVSRHSHAEGLAALKLACQSAAFPKNVEGVGTSAMPVLALGGITLENASDCVTVGAAGIAAIRLFQENDIANIVRQLRRVANSRG